MHVSLNLKATSIKQNMMIFPSCHKPNTKYYLILENRFLCLKLSSLIIKMKVMEEQATN
jgi:hypothetical protein